VKLDTRSFGEVAKSLSRNPVSIIALFIVLTYGISSLVVGFGENLEPYERLPMILFMVIFPFVVIHKFLHLVIDHHSKLYAPSDFKDERYFFELHKFKDELEADVTRRLEEQVDILKNDFEKESAMIRMVTSIINERWSVANKYADILIKKHENSSYLIQKSYILKRMNNIPEALRNINRAIELNEFINEDDKYLVYYNRACYQALLKMDKQSIFEDLIKAIEINSQCINGIKDDPDLSSISEEFLESFSQAKNIVNQT